MQQTILSFLSHGGFKLLNIAFFVIYNFAKMRAKESKKREAKLRGTTEISDFSTTGLNAAPQISSQPFPIPRPAMSKSSTSALDSPWSSNQNPFDNQKQ